MTGHIFRACTLSVPEKTEGEPVEESKQGPEIYWSDVLRAPTKDQAWVYVCQVIRKYVVFLLHSPPPLPSFTRDQNLSQLLRYLEIPPQTSRTGSALLGQDCPWHWTCMWASSRALEVGWGVGRASRRFRNSSGLSGAHCHSIFYTCQLTRYHVNSLSLSLPFSHAYTHTYTHTHTHTPTLSSELYESCRHFDVYS